MASNFDFLEEIDEKELLEIVRDGEKLFRDGYFNQCVIQFRIYAEKMTKKRAQNCSINCAELTFDDILNCLKDKISTEREKEFIDDLFFIKKEGNKCAHGEDISATSTIEVIKRAYEATINYSYFKENNDEIDKLQFDEALLVTEKKSKDIKIVDKYLKAAAQNLEKENIKKEAIKQEENIVKQRIKDKVKEAKKARKELSSPKKTKEESKEENKKKVTKKSSNKPNKPNKKTQKKQSKSKKPKKQTFSGYSKLKIAFWIFVVISLYFLTKMLFFFQIGQ